MECLFDSTDFDWWHLQISQRDIEALAFVIEHVFIKRRVVAKERIGAREEVCYLVFECAEWRFVSEVGVCEAGDIGDDLLDGDAGIADELKAVDDGFSISQNSAEFDDLGLGD
jgi:hypothetical protein